jgi:hypothetical protein
VMKMQTVEGQTDSLLKDWAILRYWLQGLPSGTTKLSVFKEKVPKLFGKNKRSCAVRTCNYGR